MWKLHRYYLRELGVNAGITFVVMFAVVLVSLVARGIQKSQGGGPLDAAMITLLFALDSFPHLVTIAFLIATVITYTRAAQDRELIAVRAAGISPRVPMTAAVLVGILLAALASFVNHYVLPEVHFRKYRVIAEVVQKVITNLKLDSDRIPIPGTDSVLTYRAGGQHELRDCTVYCPPGRSLDKGLSPIVLVDRVSIPPLDEHSLYITVLLEGIHDPIRGTTLGKFDIVVDVYGIADRDRREDRDEDVRTDQLLAEVLRGVHPRTYEAVYTLFRRCCFSLLPALLAPIGFCIAELARERGRVVALLLSLLPLAVFYFGEALSARLLRATNEPWVAWLPVALLVLFGLPLCWRQLRR
ncbi:MAG: LptF/LptG family permease [Planctomycetes bacterium]|nr:LptF/LptG family permease [Planctomycetota bacterium]